MEGPPIPQGVEMWKPVVGYEKAYEVSSEGRVRSITRKVYFEDARVRVFQGRELKQKRHPYGYPLVALCNGKKNKRYRLVHTLVMLAFVGPPPPGMEICHENPDRHPRLSGLRYDTRANNMLDKYKHGTMLCGLSHPRTTISSALLDEIRNAKGTGTTSELAQRFGVSRAHVWNIQNGKRRNHG